MATIAPPRLSTEDIQAVRDFTVRKTLEQAQAFIEGLSQLLGDADHDDDARALVGELDSVGITGKDIDVLAREGFALIEAAADRDRKAEIFHAAVKDAGRRERMLYERLSALARMLRLKLDGRAPALAKLGIPADGQAPTVKLPPARAEGQGTATTRPPPMS